MADFEFKVGQIYKTFSMGVVEITELVPENLSAKGRLLDIGGTGEWSKQGHAYSITTKNAAVALANPSSANLPYNLEALIEE